MKKYFARANTAAGCVNLIKDNLGDIKSIYILSGESPSVKSEILKKLSEKRENCECIYSPFFIGVLEGVIFRDIQTAVLDEVLTDKEIPGQIVLCQSHKISEKGDKNKANEAYENLYKAYSAAKKIHDDWEKIYINRMDFLRLNKYCEGVIEQLIGNKHGEMGTYNYKRFFGASTPDGAVNYIDNITQNLSARYFIKGRPGTGKSTFLKRLARAAEDAGFGCETYYCSFDKKSLDMVVVPELSFCVFDSTAPHELFPERQGDAILDFYEESGLSGVDEEMEDALSCISAKYKRKISEGLCYLRLGNLYGEEQVFCDKEYIREMAEKICEEIKK